MAKTLGLKEGPERGAAGTAAKAGQRVTEAKAAAAESEAAASLSAEVEEVILLRVAGVESPSPPCPALLETGGPLPPPQASSLLFPAVWIL